MLTDNMNLLACQLVDGGSLKLEAATVDDAREAARWGISISGWDSLAVLEREGLIDFHVGEGDFIGEEAHVFLVCTGTPATEMVGGEFSWRFLKVSILPVDDGDGGLTVVGPPDLEKFVPVPIPGETEGERARREDVFRAVVACRKDRGHADGN